MASQRRPNQRSNAKGKRHRHHPDDIGNFIMSQIKTAIVTITDTTRRHKIEPNGVANGISGKRGEGDMRVINFFADLAERNKIINGEY